MEAIKKFFSSIGEWIQGIVSINLNPLWLGVIAIALVLLIIIIAIVIIVVASKRHSRHKAEIETTKITVIKDEQSATEPVPAPAPVVEVKQEPAPVEPEKKEESIVEETVAEPIVEEVKEEVVPEPEKVEEKKEEPVVEETVVEPVAEQPAVEEIKEEKVVEPAPVEKKAPAKKPAAKKAPVKKSLPGKWVVELKSLGEFMCKLVASNGEVMLSSEIYSSEEGARNGIATIIKWVEEGSFVIYQDKKKNYYYKLKTSGNRLICVGEIYKSKEQCLSAVESVKRIAKGAIVNEELVEGARYVDYKPLPFDEMAKGPQGKWKVETLDDGKFSARLYASNGQLMMATEEVATRKTALNAIESVKKNSIEGNFIVDRDKFGRYYYKLRNAQKSVICIGEAYDSLSSCTKALESVRRFAINSIVIPE